MCDLFIMYNYYLWSCGTIGLFLGAAPRSAYIIPPAPVLSWSTHNKMNINIVEYSPDSVDNIVLVHLIDGKKLYQI